MKKNKNFSRNLAWVGRWSDGAIGWAMPQHSHGYDRPAENSAAMHAFVQDDDVLVLCEVTVKVVKRNGREVHRTAKALRRNK